MFLAGLPRAEQFAALLADQGVLRVHVNGGQPWKLRAESGRALNDVLLVGAGHVSAGRLVVAYATVL